MREGETGSDVRPRTPFTPRQFFREAGMVLAVCLGLALLTRLVAMAAGMY